MGLPEDLLEQANHLARWDRKRPKQASLRRAVSTAYYAVFHLLVSEAVANWKLVRHRPQLARTIEHRRIRTVCAKGKCPDGDLQAVADAFLELQQARYLADYDYSASFTRTKALSYVQTAKEAFERWQCAREKDAAQDFLLAIFVPDRR